MNKLLPISLALCGAIGMNSAHASAYAVSYNNITNFSVTGATISGWTFSNDAAVQLGLLSGGTSNSSLIDAPASCVGGTCTGWSNSFVAHGAGSAPGYSYGDAKILNTNLAGGTGAASSIGESSVFNGIGFGQGSNTLIGTLILSSAGSVAFSFNAAPYMNTAFTTAGDSASANLNFSVSLKDSLNNSVFDWAPTSLNNGITGNSSFNPGTSFFANTTGSLSAGTYSVNITMGNSVNVSAVPETDTWAMMIAGLGLVGLRLRRRVDGSHRILA